jgi:DNA-binding beta-propeller fold protein YncE
MRRPKIVHVLSMMLFAGLFCAAAFGDKGRGRHKQFYLTPAPGPVKMDGCLDDWDLSGQIEMFVVEATRSTQAAKIAAMYDARAIYISGEIADPTPMMNRHDPQVNAHRAWDADSVQFRIVVDPKTDYPVKESKFKYGRDSTYKDTRDDIVHMLLWYYTDEKTANLQMHVGMSYRLPRDEWKPHGVVPRDKFEAAYRRWNEASGYTFEYRIPWETLGAKGPLQGGDEVAGTMQVNWSRPDGLKTGGALAWAYDVLRTAGFPFQSADCWGKFLFAEENNVPRQLVSAGVPPERTLPLTFPYELPQDSEATIQLFDPETNQAVRILVAQQQRPGGRNVERWNGLDDQGKLLEAKDYRWRGIYSDPIEARYRFSVHNSGQPPYPTDDHQGGWGADHGTPCDAVAFDGGVILSWTGSEYGWGIIRTNLDGRKRWGAKNSAYHMATDGNRVYLVGGGMFRDVPGVHMIAVRDSRATRLDNGQATFPPPPGGEDAANRITGMACANGRLYVSYGPRDLIAVYDTANGNLLATWPVAAPQRLAVRPGGALAVVSEGKVLSIADGKATPWIQTRIDEPQGIAVASDGVACVANRGALQNISVFHADGTYARSIGKAGGRPAVGTYDPSGIYMPAGIAIDEKGQLWVTENADAPKRISVWNVATGALENEFFGGSSYFAYGNIDPDRPEEIYGHNVIWKIDWQKYTTRPLFTVWRKTDPNMAPHPNVDAHSGSFRLITADNGRQFGFGPAGSSRCVVLYVRDGDLYRPFAGMINPWRDEFPGLEPLKAELDKQWDAARVARHRRPQELFWQDKNGDGLVDADELAVRDAIGTVLWMTKELTLHLSSGHILKPSEVTADGRPIYDPSKVEETGLVGQPDFGGMMAVGQDGAVYALRHRAGPSLIKWSPEGAMLWNYPGLVSWRQSLQLPTPGPGRLWGMTKPMGIAGEFLAHQTYFGVNQLFRTDGMYAGSLLDARRHGFTSRAAYTGQPEGQGGTFVKLTIDGQERYFVIGGGQDVRVWEVMNLNTIGDLPGGTYTHTAEHVAKARAASEAYEAALKGAQPINIVRGLDALAEAEPVGKDIEGDRGFKARVAYDDENLYVRFDVNSPTQLVNGQGEPKILFRGGNCLDIQIATDPEADTERDEPASGDLRLLVTRQDGKPFAVRYRPRIAGFKGERTVLVSPTGEEPFDDISVVDVGLKYERAATGFTATVAVPLKHIGLKPAPGQVIRMDLGYVFGNRHGTRTEARAYVNNNSFSAHVVDDIPHESRLAPQHWGTAVVEE